MNEVPAPLLFALLLVRPAMVVIVAPGLGGVFVPAYAKIGLTACLAIAMLPLVAVPEVSTLAALAVAVTGEVAIGLALGFAVRALVAGAELAGHLSGYQIGYSYAATIDPASGVRNSMVTTLFGMLALLTLLGLDGHHAILRALAMSYESLPIGPGTVRESLVASVRDLLGLVFTVGVRLAAPIVIVLLLVEVVVGLMSRTAPALTFMVIGYPLRLMVGLVVLALVLSTVPGVTASLIDQMVRLAAGTAAAFR